jgi:uncharacterized protein (TIGR03437 family)
MTSTRLCAVLFLASVSGLFGQPRINGVSNAASGTAEISPGGLVSIYGSGLATTTRSWTSKDFSGNSLPTTLDDVSVTIGGKKAAIAYLSPGQLNVQAPSGLSEGSVEVAVTNPSGAAKGTATSRTYAPALFSFQGKYAAARHNTDAVYVATAGYFGASTTSRPAMPGEILQVYGTGFGPTAPEVPAGQVVLSPAALSNPGALRVTVGGVEATVQYAGLVAPGLYQLNVVVPLVADGDQPVVASIGGASSLAALAIPVRNAGRPVVSLTLAPSGRTIRCGTELPLTVTVKNTLDSAVTWEVNGVAGGNAAVGTVSADNVYTAPAVLPPNPVVTITAISHFEASAKTSITVTLQNPVPVVTSITPSLINPGAVTVTVNGKGFASGAAVTIAGATGAVTFVSDTKLTVSATVAMPVGRLAAVKVTNPNPGTATSVPMALPVRPAVEKMAYADAVRFLRTATFGPTPQNVVDLQAVGRDAWLAAQFSKPASTWPDPNTNTEAVSRLQAAFWNIAMSGEDQLRQRAAFALSQLLVVSAAKDVQFQQMVPYLRLLGEQAFGSYRELLEAITLHPAMGDYLDMVNNEKADAARGTVANENYARELMQLFSLGLVQLDPQGVAITSSGETLAEYDQTTVAELAKVTTGWTYAPTPGFSSIWKNMPYYFAPMVAFEDHHDTTAKRLNLPVPCVVPAGGTAQRDLEAALDCIMQQASVAPFVSCRLIQRLVMSDPSPAYLGRVASVFKTEKASLSRVIEAILTDPDAQSKGSGKLEEPILYATALLRALNARIANPEALTAQATSMGQTALAPPTVFSYFSPLYRLPGTDPQPAAPEFQMLNDATAMARVNFAYRAVTNGISNGITLDLANLQDLANTPADLVEAINQALFRGEMDAGMRDVLVKAAAASSTMAARVRSVLYAAAASPQFQVQR